MMQSVLIECVRGPDTIHKYHPVKQLLRWLRRCTLHGAFESTTSGHPFIFNSPAHQGGGSFTGPSIHCGDGDREVMEKDPVQWFEPMDNLVDLYLREVDAIPHHFHLHLMHAVEILGYKHPVQDIREWWHRLYLRLVNDMHLMPELHEQLNRRLGDTREGWLERADRSTVD